MFYLHLLFTFEFLLEYSRKIIDNTSDMLDDPSMSSATCSPGMVYCLFVLIALNISDTYFY